MSEDELQVGMRIQHSGNRGFIRYIGVLEGRGEQSWIGIEWDIVTRGKHSGSVDGVSYFTTKEQGSGSFVKASKVGSGDRRPFLQAVERRYIGDATDMSFRSEHHVVGGTGGIVEFKVHDPLLPLQKLEFVDVSGLGVASLHGATLEGRTLGGLFVAMRQLRLADSLFSSISDAHALLTEFEGLQFLDVSRNFLNPEPGAMISDLGVHSKLRTLIMNQCRFTWDSVLGLCSRTPNLQELRVYNTNLRILGALTTFKETFARLELLDLDQNSVPWEVVVSHLGALPCLRELYLSRNGLHDCTALQGTESATLFPKLKTLSLARNKLGGWQVVTALHRLHSLRHLRLVGNEITADYDTTEGDRPAKHHRRFSSRMQAIARIGRLDVLDGSKISVDERRYAEKMYATVVCGEACRRDGLNTAEQQHPRLRELWALFGLNEKAAGTVGRTSAASCLRNGLVKVTMETSKHVEARRKSVTRLMPRSVRLGRVKGIAERLLRVDHAPLNRIGVDVHGDLEIIEDESREIEFWLGSAGESQALTVVCC